MVWRTGTEYQMLEWQRAVFTIQTHHTIIHTMADSMKTGGGERGVQRQALTEHTIFKLIWYSALCLCSGHTRKPERRSANHHLQGSPVHRQYKREHLQRTKYWPYPVLVIALLKYLSIEIYHGSYSFDCLLKALLQKPWSSSPSLKCYIQVSVQIPLNESSRFKILWRLLGWSFPPRRIQGQQVRFPVFLVFFK